MRFAIPFARWRTALQESVERFPLVLLCSTGAAGSLIYSIYHDQEPGVQGQCGRLAMTVALGIPLCFSLRLLRERTPALARLPLEWLGLPLLALWWWAQPARTFDGPEIYFIRWLLLLAALHFFAAVSGYLRFRESLGFWQFNRQLFLRFCLATLYSAVLTVGLELALLSARQLFELKIDRAFPSLFLLMAGCFHPAFVLAGVPGDFATLEADETYPRGLKAFSQFALAPLVAVYTAILYAYALKILLARSWPHGWVALPVLVLAGVGIFAALLLHPLRIREEETWARWFGRNFPRALAPLSILLLLSVRLRIVDYGVTESRYLGVVAGFWILGWSLVFIVRQKAGIRWIPISLGVIACLAAYGPWSAGAISERSQLKRFVDLLRTHQLWAGNTAQASAEPLKLSTAETERLRSSLTYLLQMQGPEALRPLLTNVVDVAKLKNRYDTNGILNALHIVTESSGRDLANQSDSVMAHRDQTNELPIEGYRRLWQVALLGGDSGNWSPKKFGSISIGLSDGKIAVVGAGETAPQILSLPPALMTSIENAADLQVDSSTIYFQSSGHDYRLVFDNVALKKWPDGPRISNCTFVLLEK